MDQLDQAQAIEEYQRNQALQQHRQRAHGKPHAPNHASTKAQTECIDCGENIPPQRLTINPLTQRCTACQSRFEQRQHGMR